MPGSLYEMILSPTILREYKQRTYRSWGTNLACGKWCFTTWTADDNTTTVLHVRIMAAAQLGEINANFSHRRFLVLFPIAVRQIIGPGSEQGSNSELSFLKRVVIARSEQ